MLSRSLEVMAGERKDQESNPGLSDSKALLPNWFALTLQWQSLAQSPVASPNKNQQVHCDGSDVCPASLGVKISTALSQLISTSANAFTLAVGDLLESSNPSSNLSIFKNNTSEWDFFFLTTKENLENVEMPEDKINNPQSHHPDIITLGADSLLPFFFFFRL